MGLYVFDTMNKVGLSIRWKLPPVTYLKFDPGTKASASRS